MTAFYLWKNIRPLKNTSAPTQTPGQAGQGKEALDDLSSGRALENVGML